MLARVEGDLAETTCWRWTAVRRSPLAANRRGRRSLRRSVDAGCVFLFLFQAMLSLQPIRDGDEEGPDEGRLAQRLLFSYLLGWACGIFFGRNYFYLHELLLQ